MLYQIDRFYREAVFVKPFFVSTQLILGREALAVDRPGRRVCYSSGFSPVTVWLHYSGHLPSKRLPPSLHLPSEEPPPPKIVRSACPRIVVWLPDARGLIVQTNMKLRRLMLSGENTDALWEIDLRRLLDKCDRLMESSPNQLTQPPQTPALVTFPTKKTLRCYHAVYHCPESVENRG